MEFFQAAEASSGGPVLALWTSSHPLEANLLRQGFPLCRLCRFLQHSMPFANRWRWLVTQHVLQHLLGFEHALVAGWNLKAFLGGSIQDGNEEDGGCRQRDSENSVSFGQVDEALRSPHFWATAKMIWHLGETVREKEAGARAALAVPSRMTQSFPRSESQQFSKKSLGGLPQISLTLALERADVLQNWRPTS